MAKHWKLDDISWARFDAAPAGSTVAPTSRGALAMTFKAVGLRPQGRLHGLFSRVAWAVRSVRNRRLELLGPDISPRCAGGVRDGPPSRSFRGLREAA